MPTKQPSISWQRIRDYTEKFSWIDKRTGLRTVGYNPPAGAQQLQRVPFFIRYVTARGRLEQGYVTCLKVNRRRHLRMIQFCDSGSIRQVWDFLVIEIDGTRFITH